MKYIFWFTCENFHALEYEFDFTDLQDPQMKRFHEGHVYIFDFWKFKNMYMIYIYFF